jgi:hypothetical protein
MYRQKCIVLINYQIQGDALAMGCSLLVITQLCVYWCRSNAVGMYLSPCEAASSHINCGQYLFSTTITTSKATLQTGECTTQHKRKDSWNLQANIFFEACLYEQFPSVGPTGRTFGGLHFRTCCCLEVLWAKLVSTSFAHSVCTAQKLAAPHMICSFTTTEIEVNWCRYGHGLQVRAHRCSIRLWARRILNFCAPKVMWFLIVIYIVTALDCLMRATISMYLHFITIGE